MTPSGTLTASKHSPDPENSIFYKNCEKDRETLKFVKQAIIGRAPLASSGAFGTRATWVQKSFSEQVTVTLGNPVVDLVLFVRPSSVPIYYMKPCF